MRPEKGIVHLFEDVLRYGILGIVSMFMVLPFLSQVYMSLGSTGLSAYRYIIGQPLILRAIWNSLVIATSVTALQLFFCSMVGYGFAKHKFPGHEVLFGVLLATMIIPLGVIMLPLYLLMRDLHWIDTYQALIVPSAVGALGIFFMRQYISTIPDELLDAARLDGAGEVNLFRRVILPMSLPALASLGVIVFVNQWNNFVWPLVILQSPEKFTLPLILSSGSLAGSNYMAVAVVSLIPMAALFLIFQSRFVEGVTTGAMSG